MRLLRVTVIRAVMESGTLEMPIANIHWVKVAGMGRGRGTACRHISMPVDFNHASSQTAA